MSQKNIEQIRSCFNKIRQYKGDSERTWRHIFFLQGYLFALMDTETVTWKQYDRIINAADKVAAV